MIGEFVRAVLSTKNDKIVFRDLCSTCDDFRAHRLGGKPGSALGICLRCKGETPCSTRRIDESNVGKAKAFMKRWSDATETAKRKKAAIDSARPSPPSARGSWPPAKKKANYGTEARRRAAASAYDAHPPRTVDCSFCGKAFETRHPKKINCSRSCTVKRASKNRKERRGKKEAGNEERIGVTVTLSKLPFAKGANYGTHKLEEDCSKKNAELPWLLSCLQCGTLSYAKGRNVIARQIPACTCNEKSEA